MPISISPFRRQARRLAAIVVVSALIAAVQCTSRVDPHVVMTAAARFRFVRSPLPSVAGVIPHDARLHVHPSFERMRHYVSSIGTSVALHDIDGDGLPNDLCYVESRTDQVIVAPVPGTPPRYAPFALPQDAVRDPRRAVPSSCLPGDFDEDGHVDLLVTYAGRTPVIFFSRNGRWVPEQPFGDGIWSTTNVIMADLDGDGHFDLVFGNYFEDGANIYDDTEARPVHFPASFSRALNGGSVHVFRWVVPVGGAAVSYVEEPDSIPVDGRGGWTLAVGAQDLDGDLLPELYLANDFGPDRLLHNRSTRGQIRFALVEGTGGFATPPSKVIGRDSFKGMGVDFGDLNGDGIPDIYVSNITSKWVFQESQFAFISTGDPASLRDGRAPYVDRSEQLGLSRSGWAWDARLDDFDNDGVLEALQAVGFARGTVDRMPEYQEIGMANDNVTSWVGSWPNLEPDGDLAGHEQNPFFTRVGDRYVDVSREIGWGEDAVSRAIATADVDGDGDLDAAVANMWAPSTFYRNECPHCGAFLGLHLLLPLQQGTPTRVRAGHPGPDTPGREAIGAAARVVASDGRLLVRQVDGGNGHSGKRSADLHFGLGSATADAMVELRWRDPSGAVREAHLTLSPGWHTVVLGWPTP